MENVPKLGSLISFKAPLGLGGMRVVGEVVDYFKGGVIASTPIRLGKIKNVQIPVPYSNFVVVQEQLVLFEQEENPLVGYKTKERLPYQKALELAEES